MSVPEFSALHCPSRNRIAPPAKKADLLAWTIETLGNDVLQRDSHPCFESDSGTYTVPIDGLYAVIVQIIPIGAAYVEHTGRVNRTSVDYVLRIQEPPEPDTQPDDTIESEYYDVGSVNFAQVIHLRAGTKISCMRMAASLGYECVRLKIDILQRKRKRPAPPEFSKKELKKRKKMKRKAESIASTVSSGRDPTNSHLNAEISPAHESSDEDDADDADWSHGFESDTTEDDKGDLSHSNSGVGRLAKRFKGAAGPIHSNL